MRVLISVDLEGVAGVVDREDTSPGSLAWEQARGWMTDEASAAVRGVLAYDPDAEVVVADAHARFRNILPDRLDRRARLIRGQPRRYDMLTGIDAQTDALCLIGHHGRAGLSGSVLAHTVNGRTVADVRVDGTSVGEVGLNVLLAADFGAVPVLVSGDDTLAQEAQDLAPGITVVTVKWSHASLAAESVHPQVSCGLIEEAVPAALARRDTVRPRRPSGPVELEIDLRRPEMADRALAIPGIRRRGSATLAYTCSDFPVAHRLVGLIADLAEL